MMNHAGLDQTRFLGESMTQDVCESRSNVNHGRTDRIPSTTPGAEPPRDARDSGSARSHSTHLETSSTDQP